MNTIKKVCSKFMFTVAAALLTTMFFGLTTCAAVNITGLKQTDDGNTSVTIKWDALLDKPNYEYSISEDGKTWVTPKYYNGANYDNYTSSTSCFINGLTEGKTYYVKIKSFTGNGWINPRTYDGRESSVLKVKTSSGKAAGLKQASATETSITLNWNQSAGADYYKVYRYTFSGFAGNTYTYIGKTTGTSYKINKLKADEDYGFAVTPIADSGTYQATGASAEQSYMRTLPGKIKGLDSEQFSGAYYDGKSKYGTLKVTWEQKEKADGYQVQFFEYKNLKKVKKTINLSNKYMNYANWTKALKNKVYAVKVRPYATINNKKLYSGWTSYLYVPYQPDVSSLKVTGGKLKVSWKKVAGATSYDVYVSTSNKPNAKYTRVAKNISAKKTSAVISKYKGKKFNNKKKYFTYVVANFKKGGKTYKSDFSLYYYNL